MEKRSSAVSESRQPRRPHPAAPVTIKEVAREAGVSVATVSRVINEKGPVREETQRRIRRVVEKLRYAPHGAARSLIMRKTHTLGVLLPDLFGEFFSELIRGIDVAARQRGYHLIVSGSHGDRAETRALLRAMRGRVDGLVVLSANLDAGELEANLPFEFPVVLLNGAGKGVFDAVRVDNYGGASAMVHHVIGLGHRRIAFVTGPPKNLDAAERLRGFRDAVSRAAGTSALEIPGDFREEAGYRAAARILRFKSRPTAILAANDAMAIGLLCAFRDCHVHVPEDIALAGFDDIPMARYMTPPLTTVSVPIADLGARAAARLLHVLDETDGRHRREEILPTTLVVRASCGALLRVVSLRPRAPEPKDGPSEIEERKLVRMRKEEGR
jgi:LacI family transcriptional regulator